MEFIATSLSSVNLFIHSLGKKKLLFFFFPEVSYILFPKEIRTGYYSCKFLCVTIEPSPRVLVVTAKSNAV